MSSPRRTAISKLSLLRTDAALRRTFGYYLQFVYLGLGMGISGPTLPTLAEQTHTRLGTMGYMFLAGSIGYTLGTLFGGRIFDRVRGHPVLGAAQIAAGLFLFFIPLAPWFWLLLAIVVCKGFMDGIINTGANTLLIWTHGEKSGPFMNALHFAFGLGSFVSPLIVAQVMGFSGGYRWAYWALTVYAILVGVLMVRMPSSPHPTQHQPKTSTGTAVKTNYRLVLIATMFLFFYVGSEITYGGWVFTYATVRELATATGAAYLNSVFWFSFTLGRLLSIPLARRIVPQRMIAIALTGCLSTLALMLVFPDLTWLLWVVTASLGFFMAPIWPSGFTFAGQSIQLTAHASSIILLGDSLGGMALPWLVGQVLESVGPGAMLYLVFASLLGTLLAFLAMLSQRRAATAAQPRPAEGG
jgi:MFS transporter, FHS family, Na+ dependent glucose transporter 1